MSLTLTHPLMITKALTSSGITEMQISTTVRYPNTPLQVQTRIKWPTPTLGEDLEGSFILLVGV